MFADGNAVKTILNGTSTGTLTASMIIGNTYTVTETNPPAGCTACEPFTVTLNSDGTIDSALTAIPEGSNVTYDADNVFSVIDGYNTFTLTKTDADGNELAGSEFKVTASNGTLQTELHS